MTLTSCLAIISSIGAVGLFGLSVYLTYRQYQKTVSRTFQAKQYAHLASLTIISSLLLLYSVTYVTRDLTTGTSRFLGVSLTYENCQNVQIMSSEDESDDDEDYDGEEEIASATHGRCFLNS